jgi:hypothetical protein
VEEKDGRTKEASIRRRGACGVQTGCLIVRRRILFVERDRSSRKCTIHHGFLLLTNSELKIYLAKHINGERGYIAAAREAITVWPSGRCMEGAFVWPFCIHCMAVNLYGQAIYHYCMETAYLAIATAPSLPSTHSSSNPTPFRH